MTAITAEIERFNRLSTTWWDSLGPMRPLHVVNALRLHYVVEQIEAHFKTHFEAHSEAHSEAHFETHVEANSQAHPDRAADNALKGLRILDIGCGGGLMSEALARLGAKVVGVDASPGNVAAARLHAQAQGVLVDYRLGEPSEVLSSDDVFDVVLALEVVEHVSDVPAFLATAASCLAPGGMLFASTIDRTWKSFVFAIVGAEYVLRVLPRGTHHWSMFVRPDELSAALASSGLQRRDLRGMRYLPLLHRASWSADTQVNYIATYTHPAATERHP